MFNPKGNSLFWLLSAARTSWAGGGVQGRGFRVLVQGQGSGVVVVSAIGGGVDETLQSVECWRVLTMCVAAPPSTVPRLSHCHFPSLCMIIINVAV